MQLDEFIEETLSSIFRATKKVQEEQGDTGGIVNPGLQREGRNEPFSPDRTDFTALSTQQVEFDVAVSGTEQSSDGVKAGLKVYFFNAEAGVGSASQEQSTNRVKFSIPVALPPYKTS